MKSFLLNTLFAAACLLLLTTGCSKEEDPGETPAQEYATLEVTVELLTNNGLVKLPNADVILYEEQFYQDEGTNAVFEGMSDGNGKVRFYTLDKQLYYITVITPDGLKQQFVEDTPARTISFLSVIFKQ